MDKYVFDTCAFAAYFLAEPDAGKVAALLIELYKQKLKGKIVAINVGELYYTLCRKRNRWVAQNSLEILYKFPIEIINADLMLSLEAAKIKSRFKLSFADAFAAAYSIKTNAFLITKDKEFESLTLASVLNFKKISLADLPY